MPKDKIFFIAILPSIEIQDAVNDFKQEAARLFDSKKALTSPPHITLVPPFKWKEDKILKLKKTLSAFAEKQKIINLELNGFDAFEPHVVFIDVIKNELLISLQKNLVHFLTDEINLVSDRPKREYHPHMTIAFKDLKAAIFPKAIAHFSKIEFKRKFEVDRIVLLEHRDKRWQVDQSFLF